MTAAWTPPRQQSTATGPEVRDFARDTSSAPGPSVRLVGIVLASFYNPVHGCAYPGVDRLATACGVTDKTVTAAVRALAQAGEWTVVPVRQGKMLRHVYVPTMLAGTFPAKARAGNAAVARAARKAATDRSDYDPSNDPRDRSDYDQKRRSHYGPNRRSDYDGVLKGTLRETLSSPVATATGDSVAPLVAAPACCPDPFCEGDCKAKAAKTGDDTEPVIVSSPAVVSAAKPRTATRKAEGPVPTGLAQYLADSIRRHGLVRGDLEVGNGWAKAMRLLLADAQHKTNPDEVRAVIDWAHADRFWRKNVMSATKLRAQYGRLLLESGLMKATASTAGPPAAPVRKPGQGRSALRRPRAPA